MAERLFGSESGLLFLFDEESFLVELLLQGLESLRIRSSSLLFLLDEEPFLVELLLQGLELELHQILPCLDPL